MSNSAGYRLILIATLMIGAAAGPATAQPFYPRHALGGFLNGLGESIAREQAIAVARQAWVHVDPAMLRCLAQTVNPGPAVLANSGVLPTDPRLAVYVQRCAQLIAQAQAQRAEAARQVAEEQQRENAARHAKEAEQERVAAEQRADEQRLAAQQKAEQIAEKKARLEAEQKAAAAKKEEEAAFEKVQGAPELSTYSGRSEPDLIFLHVSASRRLIRDLNDKLVLIGNERPIICWAFPSTGASSAGFFLWAMRKLQDSTSVPRFDLSPCDAGSITDNADIVVFSTGDLTSRNAERALDLAADIKSGSLRSLFEARQKDYDDVIREEEEEKKAAQAQEAARHQQIAQEIDKGDGSGIGMLEFGGSSPGTDDPPQFCDETSVDPQLIQAAVQKYGTDDVRKGYAELVPLRLSPDDLFVNIKAGHCGVVVGDGKALETLRSALTRDHFPNGSALAWLDAAEVQVIRTALEEQKAAAAKAEAATKEQSEKKAAEEKAEADRAAQVAAAARAAKLAKERAATDSSSQLIDHP